MNYQHKVLLIEDDEFTRFMMREIIASLGAEVEIASNGDEGCKTLANRPTEFGLVLMDLHMPVMSGLDAAQKIRAKTPDPGHDVPIIAVTADVTYHDDARLSKLGIDGFASKPVSPGKLLSLIDRYCSAPH